MIKIFISIETEPCRYLFQSSPFSASILKPGFNLQEREKENLPRIQETWGVTEKLIGGCRPARALGIRQRDAATPERTVGDPSVFRPKTPAPGICPEPAGALTCLSLSCSILARRFLSGGERYFWVSNFFSNSMVWSLENLTWPPFLLCRGLCKKGLQSRGLPAGRESSGY